MFVTIPRMGATTHELGIHTLFPQVPSIVTIVVFFAISYYFSMDQSNVIEKIGKILTPLLVIILLFIVGKGIFSPIGEPIKTTLSNPFSNAFINAYQTGDVVTGIFCAPIFIAAIKAYGYKGTQMRKIALIGTFIAGLGLLIIYGGLLFIGAAGSGIFPDNIDSTALVAQIVRMLLGQFGTIALSVAIALACLTSTIGVTVVTAEFLNDLTKNKISYRIWALVVCLAGIAIGSIGVEKIVDYAMPIFLALYPVAIVLVFLGVFRKYIPNPGAYRGAILLTFIISLSETVMSLGLKISLMDAFIANLPFSPNGFAWLVPAIVGFIIGAIIYKFTSNNQNQEVIIDSTDID